MNYTKYIFCLLTLCTLIFTTGCSDQEGCTDATACNYDADADTDDDSCLVLGQSCDDGNTATSNDVVTAACTCVGCSGTLSLTVNGVAWEYDDITVLILSGPTDGIPSKTFQILASKAGESIQVGFASLTDIEADCMPLKTYYEDFEQGYCETGNSSLVCEALTTFYQANGLTANSILSVEGSGTLTACDGNNQTISGTFDANVYEFFNETLTTISGSFENLCYTKP